MSELTFIEWYRGLSKKNRDRVKRVLMDELDERNFSRVAEVMQQPPSPIGYVTDIGVEILRNGGNAMLKPYPDVMHHLPVYVGKD